MERFIFQIISVMKQKISNYRTKNASDEVCNPVVNATGTAWNQIFLHEFGKQPIGYTDTQGNPQGFSAVNTSVFLEGLAVTPQAGEDEPCIHQQMHHLVKPEDGFDMGQNRTRQSCQHQNDQCA